eukprot:5209060-Pleurochrysis_carterae.AAC.1
MHACAGVGASCHLLCTDVGKCMHARLSGEERAFVCTHVQLGVVRASSHHVLSHDSMSLAHTH